ncbi:PepSY domain-containing protein [Deinococcus detaillensis]|uniref:PepSY domain-containing protein n=1 Tax=Deinococcus detaillensis TaxID=2592048 RepID=A0A553UEG6_9DEIO|nr:PepSY domain-containing protein [Deinococcus detaillensis]TSA78600.1 PepSY domain-containing protein [Deinococcus detaillensis]
MNKPTKNALLSLTVLTALAALLAGYAFAQTASSPSKTMTLAQAAQPTKPEMADTETNDGPDTQEATIKGSIALPAEAAGAEVPDAQEQSQYQALAKISAAQASAAAQAKVPGAVNSVTLEDQDGFLVYAVKIGNMEVMVDAGNGQVLGQSAADTEDTGMESGSETSD